MNNNLVSSFGQVREEYCSEEAGWIPGAAQHLVLMGARGPSRSEVYLRRVISSDEVFNGKKSWLFNIETIGETWQLGVRDSW